MGVYNPNTTLQAEMDGRVSTAPLARVSDVGAVLRSAYPLFFGERGHGRVKHDSTRKFIDVDPVGEALNVEGFNQGDRFILDERFHRVAKLAASLLIGTNLDFAIIGTNAVDGDSTFNVEGGNNMATGALANDQMIIQPHGTANQSAWRAVNWPTQREVIYRAMIKTGASIAAEIIWAGLKLTNTGLQATDDDQAYFRYENGVNGGRWQALWSIAGVDSNAETAVTAVAASTVYQLVITIDSARVPRFYVNGVLVATGTALTTAINLLPFVGIQTTEGVAKNMVLRHCGISRNYA